MNEEMITTKNKISTWLKNSFLVIILIASLVAFALKEVIQLGPNEEFDWIKTVTNGIITYMFAIYIYLVLGELGRKKGKDNPIYVKTLKDLSDIKSKITPYVDKLPIFVAYKNRQAIVEARTNILAEAAMTYKKFENGWYKEHYNELTQVEQEAYNLASNFSIETLSARDLLCEISTKEKRALRKKKVYEIKHNPLRMGRTEQEFRSQGLGVKLAGKAIYPLVFGYLELQSLLWSNLLYGCIQAILILLGGSINYVSSESFVLTELRNRFITKADFLKEFLVMIENHSPIFNEEEGEEKDVEKNTNNSVHDSNSNASVDLHPCSN